MTMKIAITQWYNDKLKMTNGNYTMTQGQWKWQLHKYTTTTKNIDLETMGVYAFNGFSNGSDTVTQWQLQMKMAITELHNDNNK